MRRLAVITGGAQGIGRELARHFLQIDWSVAVLDVDPEALGELSDHLPGQAWIGLPCDVGDEHSVAEAFARIADWSGDEGVDLLVNNAGRAEAESGPVEELTLDRWHEWIDGHLTGAFLCTRAAVRGLHARRGSIVNIASTRALQSEPNCEAYAAAKGGLLALTHALAISLGPDVRVNAICPGWIETGHLKKAAARREVEHREVDHQQHPVGRVGEASDVAHAVEYLAGPRSGFVTGQVLVVDGGMSRRMHYEP